MSNESATSVYQVRTLTCKTNREEFQRPATGNELEPLRICEHKTKRPSKPTATVMVDAIDESRNPDDSTKMKLRPRRKEYVASVPTNGEIGCVVENLTRVNVEPATKGRLPSPILDVLVTPDD